MWNWENFTDWFVCSSSVKADTTMADQRWFLCPGLGWCGVAAPIVPWSHDGPLYSIHYTIQYTVYTPLPLPAITREHSVTLHSIYSTPLIYLWQCVQKMRSIVTIWSPAHSLSDSPAIEVYYLSSGGSGGREVKQLRMTLIFKTCAYFFLSSKESSRPYAPSSG